MGLRGQSLRGSAVLTVGEGLVQGASFVRTMILARLLMKEDFGIAASLVMVVTLLEFSAKLGVARFVVRDREGDQPEFVAAAHLFQSGAAVLSSMLMAAAAWPMALIFDLRDHVSALLVLAVIPLLNGFGHLDPRRFERELRFGPAAVVNVFPHLVITLMAWPVGVWLADYRAVLVLLVMKAVLGCAGSHWLAERPYRWCFADTYLRRMWRFGWPLLVNGFVLFGILRGDQFIVASFYTMSELGGYAAAASLAFAPTFFFSSVLSSLSLPVMARVQDDAVAFERRYRLVIAGLASFCALYSMVAIVGSDLLMGLVFGSQYADAGSVLAWLAAGNALRNVRRATAIAAIAKGDSMNEMLSNVWGCIALPVAIAVAVAGQPVWMVASSGLLGEVLACWVSFGRLSRRDGVPLLRSLAPTSLVVIAVIGAGALDLVLDVQQVRPLVGLGVSLLSGCVAAGLVLGILREPREEVGRLIRYGREMGWRRLIGKTW